MPDEQISTTLTTPEFKEKLASLFAYLAKRIGIREAPLLKLIKDKSNANNPFGFTGHYDPSTRTIVIYITDRHDTDILRSFAHEIIHHWQRLRGTLSPNSESAAHYAQNDPNLRRREMEAYLFGNILFRDWQDEQRNGPPQVAPVLPQPLDENLTITNPEAFKQQTETFVNTMIKNGTISSFHRDRTSGDMQVADFAGDLSHKVMNAVETLIQTIDDRGNWENQPNMIRESKCKKCGNICDYGNISEVTMGAIRCPSCQSVMDQEGNVYER